AVLERRRGGELGERRQRERGLLTGGAYRRGRDRRVVELLRHLNDVTGAEGDLVALVVVAVAFEGQRVLARRQAGELEESPSGRRRRAERAGVARDAHPDAAASADLRPLTLARYIGVRVVAAARGDLLQDVALNHGRRRPQVRDRQHDVAPVDR